MARTCSGWGIGPVLWKWASVQPWRNLVEVVLWSSCWKLLFVLPQEKSCLTPLNFKFQLPGALEVVCFHAQLSDLAPCFQDYADAHGTIREDMQQCMFFPHEIMGSLYKSNMLHLATGSKETHCFSVYGVPSFVSELELFGGLKRILES